MSDDAIVRVAIDSYLRMELTASAATLAEVEGLPYLRYGRLQGLSDHELLGGTTPPERLLEVVTRHPELAGAFLTSFVPLDFKVPALEAAGFRRVVRNTLMARDLAGIAPAAEPALRRAADGVELQAIADRRDDGALLPHFLSDPTIELWYIAVDGLPAASLVTVSADPTTPFVEHVHTLASHRRQGCGRRLLTAVHATLAARGAERVILGSNATGYPLYLSLGYRPLMHEDVWVVPS